MFTLEPAALLLALDITAHALGRDTSRPHLAGALVEWEPEGTLRVVTTDGHRLAFATADLSGHPESSKACMLAPKGLGTLRGLVERASRARRTAIDVALTEEALTVDGTTIAAAVDTEGNRVSFPPYRTILPAQYERVSYVERTPLLDAVRALTISAHARKRTLVLTFGERELVLAVDDEEGNTGLDVVACKLVRTAGDDGLRIGVDATLLLDALNAIDRFDLAVGTNGPLDALSVFPAVSCDALALIMPQRL